jgi:hypothetical protein
VTLRFSNAVPLFEIPSGSRPTSAGVRLKNKLIGAKIATSSRPRDQQAVRRPELAIRLCSRGRIVTEPVAFLDCSRHG